MTSSDLALAGIQRRQFGAFARRQAIEAGVAGSTVDARLAAGRYRALLRGVMSEAGAPDSPDQRRMAAQLWAGREAVLAPSATSRPSSVRWRSDGRSPTPYGAG